MNSGLPSVYMSPVPSSEGLKTNWVNYHTKVKDVYFRMDAGKKSAMISISLEHADPDFQELYFGQLAGMKGMLHAGQVLAPRTPLAAAGFPLLSLAVCRSKSITLS